MQSESTATVQRIHDAPAADAGRACVDRRGGTAPSSTHVPGRRVARSSRDLRRVEHAPGRRRPTEGVEVQGQGLYRHVHGDADRTVPYQAGVSAFRSAEPPEYLVTLLGQDHGGAFDGEPNAAGGVVARVTLDFLDAYVRNQPAALGRLTHDATVTDVASIRSAPG